MFFTLGFNFIIRLLVFLLDIIIIVMSMAPLCHGPRMRGALGKESLCKRNCSFYVGLSRKGDIVTG